QMLHQGDAPQARQTLIPLAFNPHAKADSNFALKLVKMIDAGDTAEKVAQAVPDKPSEPDTD
ncbi:MAG TPA: hypothetical protein VFO80_09910, partial [Sphingomonas sp.]|nr:hypothetical protein [Sphingomonas sp.]